MTPPGRGPDGGDAVPPDLGLRAEHAARFRPDPDPARCRLGGGGGGTVYRAMDAHLDRLVALKVVVVGDDDADDDDARSRRARAIRDLRREARLLAGLQHESIAVIHDLIDDDAGRPVLVMEHAPGGSLADHLRRGALSVAAGLDALEQVARGLHAAHVAGVHHRDVKPANVLVIDADRPLVRVADFGIAHARERTRADDETAVDRDATRLANGPPGGGTPGFAAPEQVAGAPASVAADVFSFGALAAAVLGGAPPWPGSGLTDYVHAVHAGPPDLDRVRRACPAAAGLVARCLAVEPRTRPRRLADVASELAAIRRQVGVGGAGDAASVPVGTPTPPGAEDAPTTLHPPGNLPASASAWIGRGSLEGDVREAALDHRLVTLLGAGGCGKTRLAVRVASHLGARFDGRVAMAPLDRVERDEDVCAAVGEACGTPAHDPDGLVAALDPESGPRLLLLDNCEHVVGGAAAVADALLAGRPEVRILATSREPLGLPGERTLRIPSMSLPDEHPAGLAAVEASESGRLLLDRLRLAGAAKVGDGDAPALARICRLLDGIPFAIELAAAAARTFAPEDLADRLARGLRMRLRGPASGSRRHRTMRALVDWSWERLDADERRCLARMSVLAGGGTLEQIEAIAADPVAAGGDLHPDDAAWLVGRLVDRSLLGHEPRPGGGPARYRMLETVRAFVAEQLADDPATPAVRARHAVHFAELAAAATADLAAGGEAAAASFARLDDEAANLAAAAEHAIAVRDLDRTRALVVDLARWRFVRSRYAEGRRLADALLDAVDAADEGRDPALEGAVTRVAAIFAHVTGDRRTAIDRHRRSLEAWQRAGSDVEVAACLTNLGAVHESLDEIDEAIDANDRAVAILDGIPDQSVAAARARINLAVARLRVGQVDAAATDLERALPVVEGRDRVAETFTRMNLANACDARGDLRSGLAHLEIAWRLARHELGQQDVAARCLAELAAVRAQQDDHHEAARLAAAAEALAVRNGAQLVGHAAGRAEEARTIASASLDAGGLARDAAEGRSLRGTVLDDAVASALARARARAADSDVTDLGP